MKYIAIDGSRKKTAHESFLQAQSHLEKVSFGRPCLIASSLGEVYLLLPHPTQRRVFEIRTLARK